MTRTAFLRNYLGEWTGTRASYLAVAGPGGKRNVTAGPKKGIDVQVRTPRTALASVRRGEMSQVLTNLLLNAIDALPHSGRLHVRVSVRKSAVVITIADNGAGIPAALRESLFDSFRSRKPEGNGLGLWVVQEIVGGHGGTIRYKSSEARGKSGTVFRISLPIQRAA